jgi:transcriptional regulator with XRE-family HTH domain
MSGEVSPKKASNCRGKIGGRIAARRATVGLDQGQLADAFEVSRQAISQYERGVTDVNAGDLPFLAQVLGVSVLSLFGEAVPLEDRLIEAVSRLTASECELVIGIVELICDGRESRLTSFERTRC